MEDYDITMRLGGGSFADVFKAIEKSTGETVAIKVLKQKYTKWEDCLELRECRSLQKLHEEHLSHQPGNKNIVKLKQIIFIKESGTLNLIFEYMEKDLFELMKARSPKKLNETQIRSITYQTLLGLAFMHKYGFFHRDMKPENLLVTGDTIKIADFGLAREIRSIPPYTEYVSTRYYRAPECILKSTNYNSPVDIWALGCIMAEMYLHPQPLFFGNNEKEVLYKICNILGTPNHSVWAEGIQQAKKMDIKFPNFPGTSLNTIIPQASSEAIDLMYLMLNWDPNRRAKAHDLLQHPFFTNYTIIYKLSDTNYDDENNASKHNFKKYSNKKDTNKNQDKSEKKISMAEDNLLNDTEGFDKLISRLKSEKTKEDQEYEKAKNKSGVDDDNDEEEFFYNNEYRKTNKSKKKNNEPNEINEDKKNFENNNNEVNKLKYESSFNNNNKCDKQEKSLFNKESKNINSNKSEVDDIDLDSLLLDGESKNKIINKNKNNIINIDSNILFQGTDHDKNDKFAVNSKNNISNLRGSKDKNFNDGFSTHSSAIIGSNNNSNSGNSRMRSAKKFLESTENYNMGSISNLGGSINNNSITSNYSNNFGNNYSNNNNFGNNYNNESSGYSLFNNSSNNNNANRNIGGNQIYEDPLMIKSEFPSRRNNNPRYERGYSNNEIMIGSSNFNNNNDNLNSFGYGRFNSNNNNTNNNNNKPLNQSNDILFGIKSRRQHNIY